MERNRLRWKIASILATALIAWNASIAPGATKPPDTLDPTTIPQYVTPLVIPPVMDDTSTADDYEIAVRQFKQQILPGGIWNTINGRSDMFPATTIWSYGPADDPAPDSSDLGGAAGVAPAANSQFNYPAYTIETTADVPVGVRWINDLVDPRSGRFLPHLLPIDQTLHWANPGMICADGTFRTDCRGITPTSYKGPVPIVTHVHGAHVEGHSDGYPEAWWLPAAINIPAGYATHGTFFDDATGTNPGNLGYADYVYRNDQPATTLWYHDHTLGMTRSNVYAGPAGFWLIRGGAFDMVDDTTTGAAYDGILPGPAPESGESVLTINITERGKYREIPIVIQDRSFKPDGSLFYPETRAFFEGIEPRQLQIPTIPNRRSDISPIWNPESFFDVMVVNGVSWPVHEVAPALYRFRFLNGCNSRFLWLKFDLADVEAYQIGAEQGFLPAPVLMNSLDLDGSGDNKAQLLLALAERADIIVDFRGIPDGTEIELLNIGPDEPFGGGIPGVDFDPADPATSGKVMKFLVEHDLVGESPTDPGEADEATDPADLALNAEGPLGGSNGFRDVSLNEEGSVLVCATALPNGAIRFLASVRPGENFEADCAAAGGEPFGPKAALLGTVSDAGTAIASGNALMWTDMTGESLAVEVTLQNGDTLDVYVTENPTVGDIEEWNIYNFTEDAHPIHLHLVRFAVIGRAPVGGSPNNDGTGVEPWETGFKDTVIAYPGEITTVKALFDIPGLYVWHCHIVEHEDNEMMRPYVVSPAE